MKLLGIILTAIAMIVGAVYFLEDRYVNVSEAKEMYEKLEQGAVQTFKALQMEFKRNELEDLKDKKIIMENELRRDPNNTFLKIRKEEIDRKIKRLEQQLDTN